MTVFFLKVAVTGFLFFVLSMGAIYFTPRSAPEVWKTVEVLLVFAAAAAYLVGVLGALWA